MSDFLTAARVAENQQWVKRVNMIAVDVAVDVLAEDPEAADHEARADLARAVLRQDQAVAGVLPRVALTNETVRTDAVAGEDLTGGAVSDGDLLYTVTSIWTPVARALFG